MGQISCVWILNLSSIWKPNHTNRLNAENQVGFHKGKKTLVSSTACLSMQLREITKQDLGNPQKADQKYRSENKKKGNEEHT